MTGRGEGIKVLHPTSGVVTTAAGDQGHDYLQPCLCENSQFKEVCVCALEQSASYSHLPVIVTMTHIYHLHNIHL